MKRLVVFLFMCLALSVEVHAETPSPLAPKRVFFLNSYHRGYPLSDEEMEGADSVFNNAPFPIEVHSEFMDAKRIIDSHYQQDLLQIYQMKYRRLKIDLVFAADNDALEFMVKNRPVLFPDAPLVFSGINDFSDAMIEGQENITGVVEDSDYVETIEAANSIIPGLGRIVVVSDRTTTGAAHDRAVRKIEPLFRDQLEFEHLMMTDLTFRDLLGRLSALRSDSAVLMLSHMSDSSGEIFPARESGSKIARASSVPVFVVTSFRVGYGTLGGKVVNSIRQGQLGAQLALRILKGEPAGNIPILRKSPNNFLFDALALERFHIPESSLPPGAGIINKDDTYYGRYSGAISATITVIIFLVAVIGILSLNIVRRRRAESALRESEEKYRKILETAHEGIVALDENFNLRFVNKGMAELLGYDPSDMMGRPVVDFVHPDEIPDHYRKVTERKQRRSGSYERRFMKRNGEFITAHISAQPLFDENDRFSGVFTMATDITQQKQMEQALQEAQALLVTALDQSIAGIVICDAPSGRIRLVNKAAEQILLQSKEEQMLFSFATPDGRTFNCFRSDGSRYKPEELPLGQAVLKGNTVENVEIRVVRSDGSERWINCCASPIRNVQEVIVAGFQIFSDITMQKQYQTDLQRAAKLESVGVLAGGIAHDFNNLLSAIVGNAGAMKILLAQGDADRCARCVSEIEDAAMRARDLTQQLLTFSRGGAPVPALLDLSAVLREAASFALTGSRNRCETEPSKIWPVFADRGQISQVIHNLLLNADQAMPQPGTIRMTAVNVNVTLRDGLPLEEGPYVRITVEDKGVGIPGELISKIFDPFFTTKQRGSGLGLASVYSIVKSHNGHITVQSAPGQGSIFSFYIPARPAGKVAGEAPVKGAKKGKSLRILILDDEILIRNMLEEALRNLGHAVCTVPEGSLAVEEFEKEFSAGNPYDLLVLDLTVPGGMGGRDVVHMLNERHGKVRAIASTGYATDPILANYKAHGFAGRLAKPYRIEDLVETIEHVMAIDAF